ncbi:MAG TPA: sulfatase-like hydrolase/transferase [Gemmataceae bacterium]|nr:sulfatase-like hydrolase/transferase [Gemmataceae bacterium]
MNCLIWLVLDSCRHDSFVRARKPAIDGFLTANGTQVERRWSYASWTAPAHYAFLMGLLPHRSPRGVFASEVYREEFALWSGRLGVDGLDFARFLPHLSLPRVLRELGYRTVGRVSLPVLNESTLLSAHFDDYRLMERHDDFAGMIAEMTFPPGQPIFYFCNLGETHYPYMLTGEDLPRLRGVHGALRDLRQGQANEPPFFDAPLLARLHQQQVRCVEYVDGLFGELLAKCPRGTHIILTADHGELFGEGGYFGHGPVMHEKVFEVPFFEGKTAARL